MQVEGGGPRGVPTGEPRVPPGANDGVSGRVRFVDGVRAFA